ncbi:hypothetical protein N7475_001889 [Penicillium sp. IBT 31633x]|nr:hypothetical protein N7475_001889 [Penicillium sp. IBT 31633x]
MSDRNAANASFTSQEGPGNRNGQGQTAAVDSVNGTSINGSAPGNESPERRQQIIQQEIDLNYYRKFLEDLVAVMRDAHSDAVAHLIALIRSGASKEEIHLALQTVQNGS